MCTNLTICLKTPCQQKIPLFFSFGFSLSRSSRPQMFFKIDVLKISQYSQENNCFSVSVNKVAGLKICNFIKKRLQHSCFPVNIVKFSETPLFTEHLRWLLLPLTKLYVINGNMIFSEYCYIIWISTEADTGGVL